MYEILLPKIKQGNLKQANRNEKPEPDITKLQITKPSNYVERRQIFTVLKAVAKLSENH